MFALTLAVSTGVAREGPRGRKFTAIFASKRERADRTSAPVEAARQARDPRRPHRMYQALVARLGGRPARVSIRGFASLLAPGGGVLLLQETGLLESSHPALARYYELVGRLQSHYGERLYIGVELEQLAADAAELDELALRLEAITNGAERAEPVRLGLGELALRR